MIDQVLLVTGGKAQQAELDSTETMVYPGGSWTTLTTATLPSPRSSLRAATLNNVVFIFGKKCLNDLKYFIFHLIIYL